PGSHQRQLPQALALSHQPLLERFLVQVEPGEQFTAIESDGAFERGQISIRDQTLEGDGVDLDGFRIQRHHVAVDTERLTSGAERRPQTLDGLPETLACLTLTGVAPQECRELTAGTGMAGSEREI